VGVTDEVPSGKNRARKKQRRKTTETQKNKDLCFLLLFEIVYFFTHEQTFKFQVSSPLPLLPVPPKKPESEKKNQQKITANIGNHLDSPKLTDIVPTPIFPQSNFLKTVFQL
jgi:hypothetical protein